MLQIKETHLIRFIPILRACQVDADVVIDFSSAKAVDALLDYCGEQKLPVVLCTTGLSVKNSFRK